LLGTLDVVALLVKFGLLGIGGVLFPFLVETLFGELLGVFLLGSCGGVVGVVLTLFVGLELFESRVAEELATLRLGILGDLLGDSPIFNIKFDVPVCLVLVCPGVSKFYVFFNFNN